MDEKIKYYYELFEVAVKENNKKYIVGRVANILRLNNKIYPPPFNMEIITGIILKKYKISGLQSILDNAWKILEENKNG